MENISGFRSCDRQKPSPKMLYKQTARRKCSDLKMADGFKVDFTKVHNPRPFFFFFLIQDNSRMIPEVKTTLKVLKGSKVTSFLLSLIIRGWISRKRRNSLLWRFIPCLVLTKKKKVKEKKDEMNINIELDVELMAGKIMIEAGEKRTSRSSSGRLVKVVW